MKYEITIEENRITECRPIDNRNRFEGLCIGAYEASGMSTAMLHLVDYLKKEKPNDLVNRVIEITEDYARTLKYLAKQLGYEDDQAEKENEC